MQSYPISSIRALAEMLVWYVLRCDKGHSWEVLHDDTREFPHECEMCEKDGLEAVTLQRMPPADRVRVTIAPAARVSDEVTGRVALASIHRVTSGVGG
jgi:hypothetical protein